MNGFEPLRRRVIDYTVAGQWQEVYDGPIEECEEYRLQAENAKLREACAELLKMAERHDPEWLHWPEMHDELRKLRVEVDG